MTLLADTGAIGGLLASLPFWPLIGAILTGIVIALRRGRSLSDRFVIGGVAVSALMAIVLFVRFSPAGHGDGSGAGVVTTLYRWISLGDGRWAGLTYYIDTLTVVMLLVVTIVSLMVVIYSVGYMRDHHGHPERGYERFFAFLGLFVFSMCMLVLAGNFVLLYLGWELVGLCSYLLIGFYYPRPAAAAAAKKAFIVNRIGDFGFAVGIFALYACMSRLVAPGENPLDYAVVFRYADQLSQSQATLIALLLLCGAIGKSAQIPLYVWLPDAMEGPTPVSALIHAATMVTAGVYMVARCGPLYAQAPEALEVVAVLGAAGALFSATIALAQYDMKRILAYSTISQLAYMFVALGCQVPDSGIFHLYTHAFFKALLFLTAGSVMHAMGGIIDLRQFSGLRRSLPLTWLLMLIGCLALAGFPLLSGFWSKDEIVHAAFYSDVGRRLPWLGWVMLLTSLLTAYYTFRMFFLCFHGPLRLPAGADAHPREMPPVMNGPLVVLALGAVLAGYVGVRLDPGGSGSFLGLLRPHGAFHHYLESSTVVKAPVPHDGAWLMYTSAIVALAGILLAWARYGTAPREDPDARALGALWRVLHHKYYVDEAYERIFVRPLHATGRLCYAVDRFGIDGLVWLVALVPKGLGALTRTLQRGALQGYALSMVVGVLVLVLLWSWLDARP